MQPSTILTARRNDIVVDEVVDELLIYDRRADVAHCLSEIAATVWRACEGGATLSEIAEQIIARDLAGSSDEATELADTAVAELIEKGLLQTSGIGADRVSRRQALRRMVGVGAAAVVAPLVVSAAVPKSALAHGSPASCVQTGSACSHEKTINSANNNNCCTSTGDYCSANPTAVCTTCVGSGQTPPGGCSGANKYECCSNACQASPNQTLCF